MEKTVQAVYHSAEVLLKKPHFHDCHQIILILRGNVEFCVNGTVMDARAGDVAIFSRYENHSVRVISEEYERYILQINPDAIFQKSPVYALLTDRPGGLCNVIKVASRVDAVAEIFRQLMEEQNQSRPLADEMEQLLVKQLLIAIYRCVDLRFDSLQDSVVIDLKRKLETNYREQHTLEGLAREYNISISSLSHRFRRMTGVSVMAYLQSCRMAHAKRMLADMELPIGEIVELCGFSDSSNFSRTFKRLNGMSPVAFRKRYKQE